jgi:hypothetical protein
MRKLIWIAFDLGIKGDYEGMYRWLDVYKAKECGDNIAVLNYEYNDDLKKELIADIQNSVETDKRSRLYVVYPESGKTKGSFIMGERRSSPWTGYAPIPGGMGEDVS